MYCIVYTQGLTFLRLESTITTSSPLGGAGGPITNVPAGGGAGGPITCVGGCGRDGLTDVGGGTGAVGVGFGLPPGFTVGFEVADGFGGCGVVVVVEGVGGGVGLSVGQVAQWYTRLHFFSQTSVSSSSHSLTGWLRQVDLYLTHWQSCTFSQHSWLFGGLANSNF